ncbi:hypothetical protein [Pseudomonas sp. p1(2021b)]|uniref:hypothetical protein n=1 Tax=Pseudomonas sp. p1(2021b) TaxID=2874628 RepID=UPI003D2D0FBB
MATLNEQQLYDRLAQWGLMEGAKQGVFHDAARQVMEEGGVEPLAPVAVKAETGQPYSMTYGYAPVVYESKGRTPVLHGVVVNPVQGVEYGVEFVSVTDTQASVHVTSWPTDVETQAPELDVMVMVFVS